MPTNWEAVGASIAALLVLLGSVVAGVRKFAQPAHDHGERLARLEGELSGLTKRLESVEHRLILANNQLNQLLGMMHKLV